MPKKTNVKRRLPKKNRTTRKRRGVTKITKTLSFPMPEQLITDFRYVMNGTITPGASGTTTNYVFRCNSCYDPDYTVAGHQPLGWDEMTLFYVRCAVISSKIKATFCLNSGAAGQNVILGIHIDDDVVIPSLGTTALEQSPNKVTVLGIDGAGEKVIRSKWHYKKNLGYQDPIQADNNSTMASLPAVMQYYNIFACALDGTSSPAAVPMLVELKYKVMLYKRIDLLQS